VHDRQLARAQQWHVAEAQVAGGQGGELADQVLGRGEDDRDQVVVADPVAGQQLGDQFLGPLDQVAALVGVDRGRAAQGDEPLGRGGTVGGGSQGSFSVLAGVGRLIGPCPAYRAR
jgi:hypothetical protein